MPKGRKKKWKLARMEIDPTCHYCKKRLKDYKETTVDHVIPRSKGTVNCNDKSNWVLCCKQCNYAKGSRDADEFIGSLEKKKKKKKTVKHVA